MHKPSCDLDTANLGLSLHAIWLQSHKLVEVLPPDLIAEVCNGARCLALRVCFDIYSWCMSCDTGKDVALYFCYR